MEQSMDKEIWEKHMMQMVIDTLPKGKYNFYYPKDVIVHYLNNVKNVIQTQLATTPGTVQQDGFRLLDENDATNWLFLNQVMFQAEIRKELSSFDIPVSEVPSIYQMLPFAQSFFERLLMLEANIATVEALRPINRSRLEKFINKAFHLLQVHNSIQHHFELLDFAPFIPHSNIIPSLTHLTTRGLDIQGRVPAQALSRFVSLKSIKLDRRVENPGDPIVDVANCQRLLSYILTNLTNASLPKLTTLYLSFNLPLPDDIFKNVSWITQLHLNGNGLSKIPTSITHLTWLAYLNVAHNALTKFPESILSLPHLHTVDLGHNQITTIPKSLADGRGHYNLEGNMIDDLPQFCQYAQEAHRIQVLGNPLRRLSPEFTPFLIAQINQVTKGASKAVLTHLFYWLSFHEDKDIRIAIRKKFEEILPEELFDQIKKEWGYRKYVKLDKVIERCLMFYKPMGLHWPLLEVWFQERKQYEFDSISFSHKHLYKLPEELFEYPALQNLTSLSLYKTQLDTLPSSMYQLRLRSLNISENLFEGLPDNLAKLSVLNLNVSDNQLRAIPSVISKMPRLETLNLRANKISAGFDTDAPIRNLSELDLSDNCIETLPKVIGKMTDLHTLHLSGNPLKAGMEALAQLKSLNTLYLTNSGLEALPENIGKAPNLLTLYLDNNKLRERFEYLQELTSLESLHLTQNQLTQMPKELVYIKNLKYLDLSENNLGANYPTKWYALPPEISHMDHLIELNLRGNELKTLPPGIGLMENLKVLDLGFNQLQEFPIELCESTSLREISVANNNISRFPKEIREFKNLRRLMIEFNPLSKQEKERLVKMLPKTKIYSDKW